MISKEFSYEHKVVKSVAITPILTVDSLEELWGTNLEEDACVIFHRKCGGTIKNRFLQTTCGCFKPTRRKK